uniref:Avh320 n=1 Tax=Phytophthora sojae TaxID=67593 RepID=G1FSS9_PHYSO|nr:Avh320 [Phytophthora sojae]
MRVSQLLVVVVATCLLTSEALTTTADHQATLSKVAVANGPTPRLLRSHRATAGVSEERAFEPALTIAEMQKLMLEGVNEVDYAKRLGITETMANVIDEGYDAMLKFTETDEHKKYMTYRNHLIVKRKAEDEAKRLADRTVRLKALKKAKSRWSTVAAVTKFFRKAHR